MRSNAKALARREKLVGFQALEPTSSKNRVYGSGFRVSFLQAYGGRDLELGVQTYGLGALDLRFRRRCRTIRGQ